MKKVGKFSKASGQAVIIVALFISAVIVTTALAISRTSTQHQLLKSYSYNEVVEDIDQDISSTLERTLAEATKIFVESADFEPSRKWAKDYFTYYVKSLLNAYSGIGLQLNVNLSKTRVLQPEKELTVDINGVTKTFTIKERKVTDLIKAYWYSPESISAIYVPFQANVTGYGFYGWKDEILLSLTLDIVSINAGNQYTNLTFRLFKEGDEPVGSLKKQDVSLLIYDPDMSLLGNSCWVSANVIDLSYNGGGIYSVNYKNSQSWSPQNVLQRSQYVFLSVKDDRGIYVEAASFTGINVVIKENITPTKEYAPDQIYVFEVLQDGRIYWYDRKLNLVSSDIDFAPIPPLPVKQFRVYTTRKGPSDKLYETSYQVETWTTDYSTPTHQFADWRRRFDIGNKLVFTVNYTQDPDLAIDDTVQRVLITWFDDTDAMWPEYRITMSEEPPFKDISTPVYKLRLLANEGFSYAVDWTVGMYYGDYHVEYLIGGVGWILMNDPSYRWIPHILPGGDWEVLSGPVRAVAYRNSDRVERVEAKPGGGPFDIDDFIDDPGAFHHTDIILIPSNTKYWQLFENIRWLVDWTDHRYYSFLSIISGTQGDQGSSLRVTSWAHQWTNYSIHSGSYSSSHATHDNEANFLYWYAQYRTGFGEAVMPSQSYVDSIKNLFGKVQGSYVYRIWIWTTADFARRVVDSLAYGYNSDANKTMTIKAGTNFSWNAGVWAYGGSGYNDVQIYYKMFTGKNDPTILSITAG